MRFLPSSEASLSLLVAFLACTQQVLAEAPKAGGDVTIDASAAAAGANGVPSLKKENFEAFIKDNKLAMVKFFAPWCTHCVKMVEPYKKAGEVLKQTGVTAAVAEVDCTQEKELCEAHRITGYPSLKVFRASNIEAPLDYKGGRDTESIVDYLKRLSLPAVQELKADQVKKHVDDFKSSLVVVANMAKSSNAYSAFEKAAEALREEFSFALVEGKDNSITVFKNFDEGEVKYGKSLDNLTEKDLIAWIQEESIPLMAEINQNNYEKYINAKKPMAYLFYEGEEMRKTYGDIVQKVMKPFKGKINSIFISVKDFGEHAKNLNLDMEWPGFVIHDIEDNLKYPLTGKDKAALSTETLETFVKKFVDGSLEPYYKSEPVPTEDNGPIKTVVLNNFDKVVLDTSKDVFLEVYAPWCGACKRIAPELEKLAEIYGKQTDKIIIAKMDGIANDLPKAAKFTLEHFPSLLLYKAGSNELVEMKQLGGFDEIHEFIQKNAANKVEIDVSQAKEAAAAAEEKASESAAESALSEAEPATDEELDKMEL